MTARPLDGAGITELAELQALPFPTCADYLQPQAGEADPFVGMEDHFRHFLPPNSHCVMCGSRLAGRDVLEALASRFEWSLAWGTFHCGECGYPGRYYHALHRASGKEEVRRLLTQMHPDFVERKAAA